MMIKFIVSKSEKEKKKTDGKRKIEIECLVIAN